MKITAYFEKRDIWIGVYWDKQKNTFLDKPEHCAVWICIIPCLPIKISWNTKLGKPSGNFKLRHYP